MAYPSLHFGDKEVVVTPDLIRDFGRQLQSQIENISPTELIEMLDAAGLFDLTPKLAHH